MSLTSIFFSSSIKPLKHTPNYDLETVTNNCPFELLIVNLKFVFFFSVKAFFVWTTIRLNIKKNERNVEIISLFLNTIQSKYSQFKMLATKIIHKTYSERKER